MKRSAKYCKCDPNIDLDLLRKFMKVFDIHMASGAKIEGGNFSI
jgi:hypothetical protein